MSETRSHILLYGFGKAGSTFIYDYLRQHKNFATPIIKEPYFFNKNFRRGMHWYISLFELNKEIKAFGDFSNQNYRYGDTLSNLKNILPNSKILLLDRSPVERLVSARKFDIMNGSTASIQTFLNEWPKQFLSIEYLKKDIKEFFPDAEVLVINLTDLINDEDAMLKELCAFVNIPYLKLDTNIQTNPSLLPRSRIVAATVKLIAILTRKLGYLKLLQTIKSNWIVRKLLYQNKRIVLSKEDLLLIESHVDRLLKDEL